MLYKGIVVSLTPTIYFPQILTLSYFKIWTQKSNVEDKTRGSVPSEGGVLRAKKLGGDGLAVRHGGFSIKIRWKDVCVKLFNVAVQLIAVNKDLREKNSSVRSEGINRK